MILDFVKRAARQFLVSENIETEIYWLLVVFRWFLIILMVLLTVLGVSFVVQDAILIARLWQGSSIQSQTLGSSHVFRTLLIGTVAFVVPRLIWNWYVLGVPLQRTQTDHLLPQPQVYVPAAVDETQHMVQKYSRILTEVESWTQANFRVNPSLFVPYRTAVKELGEFLKVSSSGKILVIGRQSSGKSSLLRALDVSDELVEYVGLKGQVVEVATLDSLNIYTSALSDVLLEYVHKKSFCPDKIIYTVTAKEVHSQSSRDEEYIKKLIWLIQSKSLCSVRVPVVAVVTKIDELHPSDLKHPSDYDEIKLQNIAGVVSVCQSGMFEQVVPVCSLNFGGASRDYRYNIERVQGVVTTPASRQFDGNSHVHFGYRLVEIFVKIATVMPLSTELLKKYQLEVFMVSIISLELGSQDGSYNPRDPIQLANGIKEFWLCLGISNLTMHSMKTVASSMLNEVPLGQLLGDVLESSSGVQLSLESLTERLGHAAVAYFAERKSKSEVQQIFQSSPH